MRLDITQKNRLALMRQWWLNARNPHGPGVMALAFRAVWLLAESFGL